MADNDITPEQAQLVAAMQEKVNRWLADFAGGYQVDSDGDTFLKIGSTRVYVRAGPWGDDGTVVRVFSWILMEVPLSEELLEFVAFEGSLYQFGRMRLSRLMGGDDPDKVGVMFDHVLLGDYLDQPELEAAVSGVGFSGDDLDTEMKERFGGQTWYEDED